MSAFWVRNGQIYEVLRTHIRFVLDNPGLFDRTKDDLIAAFRKYGEKIGFEGKARARIIREAVDDGWVRVRHYRGKENYWSFHCSEAPNHAGEASKIVFRFIELGYISEADNVLVNGKYFDVKNREV